VKKIKGVFRSREINVLALDKRGELYLDTEACVLLRGHGVHDGLAVLHTVLHHVGEEGQGQHQALEPNTIVVYLLNPLG
jgi:hypothetical protein